MAFDFDKVLQSKSAYRRQLAALPIAKKLEMLEALRERQITIQRAAKKAKLSPANQEPTDDSTSSG